jgi:replicative DNA helicase
VPDRGLMSSTQTDDDLIKIVEQGGPINDYILELLELEERWARHDPLVQGLPSSFPSLTEITDGYHPGTVTVFGARTGHGKTVVATQEAFTIGDELLDRFNLGGNDPGQIVTFSPEMHPRALLLRTVSARTGIPSRKVKKGLLSTRERESWRRALMSLSRFDPFMAIEGGESIDIGDLVSATHEIHRRRRVALLIVDYLQRINGTGRNPYERATDVSRRLKDLANSLHIPILVMSQVKRPEKHLVRGQFQNESEERPHKEDLRDSGSIEQDADVVIMLFNPPPEEKQEVGRGPSRTAMLYVDKQREGPTGGLSALYYPRRTYFEDIGEYWIDGE